MAPLGGELDAEASDAGSPALEASASTVTPVAEGSGSDADAGNEATLGVLPLAPSEGDGGRSGMSAGESAGENGIGRADGGVGSDVGSGNVGADAGSDPPRAPCRGSEFGGSCYEFFAEPLPWGLAELRCLVGGGHLAIVQSREEDEFLEAWPMQLAIPLGDGTGIWLGGTDAAEDGQYRWVDASPLSFTGWAPNQPDDGPGVDCIEKRNDGTLLWYDRRCSDPRAFVCERPL